jgi:hypothetical protein
MSKSTPPNRQVIRKATYKLNDEFMPEVLCRICKIEVDLAKSQGWDHVLVSMEYMNQILTLNLSGVRKNEK